jgi:cytochrome c biogenesis protein ResB
VKLTEKGVGRDLGVWLAAVQLSMSGESQRVEVGGKRWAIALRFPRTYKPYEITLRDFQFAFYPGTEKPKDFSAYVTLSDRSRGSEREARIWMNNPLRYHGDTLYQSSWDGGPGTRTTLQVVTNAGWMIPYVACMIVATGMLGQFWITFSTRFASRKGVA